MSYKIFRDELIDDLSQARKELQEGAKTANRILKDLEVQFACLPDGEVVAVSEELPTFRTPQRVLDFRDVLSNAECLFAMHPAPWSFKTNSLVGYVVDANRKIILGGENHEGRVDETDKGIVALVDVINSLWVYMKGEN